MTAERLLKKQRAAFLQGKTLDTGFRRAILRRLEKNIEKYQPEIEAALKKDLNKSAFEAYMTETGLTLSALSYALKHLDSWTRRKWVATPIAQMPAVSFVVREPYGNVLVMAPWNYPFLLAMEPFIGAIAAGNCCIVKPSEYAPNTGDVIKIIIEQSVPSWLGAVVLGDQEVSEKLLDCRFDYFFYRKSGSRKRSFKKGSLASDAGYSGTGGQKSLHCRKERRYPDGCKTDCIWKIFKCRANLCGAGLYSGAENCEKRIDSVDKVLDLEAAWGKSPFKS